MSGYLDHLVARSLGTPEVVRPVISPLYAGLQVAPAGELAAEPGLEVEEVREGRQDPAVQDRPAAPVRASTVETDEAPPAMPAPGKTRAPDAEARRPIATPERQLDARPAAHPVRPSLVAPLERSTTEPVPRARTRPRPALSADPTPTDGHAVVGPPAIHAAPAVAHPSRPVTPPGPARSMLASASAPAVQAPRVATRIDAAGPRRVTPGPRDEPGRRDRDDERTVEISIGRIEIRATPGGAPIAAPATSRRTAVSLDAYLLARSREGRA